MNTHASHTAIQQTPATGGRSTGGTRAAQIRDGGLVPFIDLLHAQSLVRMDVVEGGYRGDDPRMWALGLCDYDYSVSQRAVSRFHLADGIRNGTQVVFRRGLDEVTRGSVAGPRRNLHQLLIRAELPSFEITTVAGSLVASADAPDAVHELLDGLAASAVWSSLAITAGNDGIVFVRPAEHDIFDGFVYDLWLGELLVAILGAGALAHELITTRFRLPYRLERGPSLFTLARTAIA